MGALETWAERAQIRLSDISLLQRALTHRSYVNENRDALEDNERLEYLGDAALDFVTAAWLYKHFPEMDEGQLTRLRSALVRTEQLASFAEGISLGDVMRLGRGEELSGGRMRPALLCATFEALVGAIYLDAGMKEVRRFMEPKLAEAVKGILEEESLIDARSLLQIWAQAEVGETPVYRTLETTGPDHDRMFLVEVEVGQELTASGRGSNKQEAAQAAASAALSHIDWPHSRAD
jgi:ribonuclease-3